MKGIFIEGGFIPDGYGCGYSAVKELIGALELFKSNGKPVVVIFPLPLNWII